MKVADSYVDKSVEAQLQIGDFRKAIKLLREQKQNLFTKILHDISWD